MTLQRGNSSGNENKLNKQLAYLDKKISDYQQALSNQDAADDKAGKGSLVEDGQLAEKIKRLQEKQVEKTPLIANINSLVMG